MEYQYVRKYFYGSSKISRTIDFYRGYLAFKDNTNTDLGCIDGGVEAIVYDKNHDGKCLTTFFSNEKEKCSFNSFYYWFHEVRLRHKLDVLLVHHIYPTEQQWKSTFTFDTFMLSHKEHFNEHPDDHYVITIGGAALHYLHELYGSKRYNLDIRVCLKKDYIEPKDQEGMGIHRRFVACVPQQQVSPLVSFMASRVFSYMCWISQTGRHIDLHNMRLIPSAPFEENINKVWRDSELYAYLNLTDKFINHIIENTKIMPIPRTSVVAPTEYLANDILAGKHKEFINV